MQTKPRINLLLFLILALVEIASAPIKDNSSKTKIAGQAVHPDKSYSEWTKAQSNPDFKPEDKVKSTVNTFFIIMYDSWVEGTLLDFGFLFVQADPQAYEDYTYERGLMHYLLEGWKYGNALLVSYDYHPKYYDLKINEREATVAMSPKASIVIRRMPDSVNNGPWTDYVFSLESVSGQWLIRSVRCNDENHEAFPHGTDFGQMAADLPDRMKAFEAKAEAEHQERMQNDPKYREMMETRRMIKLQNATPEKYAQSGYRQFSETACRSYAETYTCDDKSYSATNYNPFFLHFAGDCQNFVSQCIWWGYSGLEGFPTSQQINEHSRPMIENGEGVTWWCDGCSVGSYRYPSWIEAKTPWNKVKDFKYMYQYNYLNDASGFQAVEVHSLFTFTTGDFVTWWDSTHTYICNRADDEDHEFAGHRAIPSMRPSLRAARGRTSSGRIAHLAITKSIGSTAIDVGAQNRK